MRANASTMNPAIECHGYRRLRSSAAMHRVTRATSAASVVGSGGGIVPSRPGRSTQVTRYAPGVALRPSRTRSHTAQVNPRPEQSTTDAGAHRARPGLRDCASDTARSSNQAAAITN